LKKVVDKRRNICYYTRINKKRIFKEKKMKKFVSIFVVPPVEEPEPTGRGMD